MSSNNTNNKLVLVIGATGAQGIAVVKALLNTTSSNPPFRVRALTRDLNSRRARELADLDGVELFQGNMHDLDGVKNAMKDCYGVYVNIDGFSCGEETEMYLGMRIFEIARGLKTVKHYVWSSLDYVTKKGGYNIQYRCEHYDAKGRVADWLKAQPSDSDHMIWSVLTSGPYMDMLYTPMFGPVNKRKDGTFVFASPIGDGHVPMIALSDLGLFARYIFDNPELNSARDLEVATELVGWEHLVETFTKVTGEPAVFVRQTLDEWFSLRPFSSNAVAIDFRGKEGSHGKTTWRENFSGWWSSFRDDVIKRDIQALRNINPNGTTLEKWLISESFDGDRLNASLLKIVEDNARGSTIDHEKARLL